MADGGAATWDLMQLYEGGLNATSFTRAFVDVKTQEIMRQFELEVMPSDPCVNLVNVTGPIAAVGPGDTATFEVRFTGDGAAHSFDLLFVRPPGIVLGSVPVSLAGRLATRTSPRRSTPMATH